MSNPSGILFQNPIVKPLDSNGKPQALCTATFYLTGTTTLTPVYSDGTLQTPLANPLPSDASGTFPAVYMDPQITYRVVLKTQTGVLISDTDPYLPSGAYLTGTFTMGTTGFTAPPSGQANYIILFNRVVICTLPILGPTASNANTFTLTGIPPAIVPTGPPGGIQEISGLGATDNATEIVAFARITVGSNVIVLSNSGNNSGWTPTGLKGIGLHNLMWLLS